MPPQDPMTDAALTAGLMGGYQPGSFAPMGATYQDYISGLYGANPLAANYASNFAPYAQLQYLASGQIPSNIGATGAANPYTGNPFGSFLTNTPAYHQGYQPWADTATSVLGALQQTGATDLPTLRIQERFGAAGGEQAMEMQRRLADAVAVQATPYALRGETQNILNRLYNRFLTRGEGDQGYLQYALEGIPGGSGGHLGQFAPPAPAGQG